MRLTRGTIALIGVAVLVIIAVLVFNTSPASAPAAPTDTPETTTAGPLFAGLEAASVTRLTVEDYATGLSAVYARDEAGGWALDGDTTGYTVDSTSLEAKGMALAGLEAADTFTSGALADYGLDQPLYRVQAVTADGAQFTLWVGGMNPTGTRRYVIAETSATPSEATPEAEATVAVGRVTLTGEQTISTVVSSTVQQFTSLLTTPPFLPTPQPTPTTEGTPEVTAEAATEAGGS